MRKFLLKLSYLSFIGGILYIVGNAGTSDINPIDFNSTLSNVVIGLAFMVSGYIGLRVNNCEGVND